MLGPDQVSKTSPMLAYCGPQIAALLQSDHCGLVLPSGQPAKGLSHHRRGLAHPPCTCCVWSWPTPAPLPASQPASVQASPPADAVRPVQEDSIRTDDLLERIQDSGRCSRHSIAGSEPPSAELPSGQLSPQASWALRRRSADQSASSLKRAREAVQSQPLALRLDVLAGPTMDQAAFQSQVGMSEVRAVAAACCAEQHPGVGSLLQL